MIYILQDTLSGYVMQRLTIIIALLLALSGCVEFPGVHKIDVPQGNIITRDMIDQLEPGMSRKQVKYIMGSPLLQDTFNSDRWDYYYILRSQTSAKPEQHISLYFKGDKLDHFEGNIEPSHLKED